MNKIEQAFRQASVELSNRDPKLAVLIAKYGPLAVGSRAGGFPDLASTIIGQQLSDRAAQTIQTRVEALFPGKKLEMDHLDRIEDAALRRAGLSMQKINYIRGLAAHIAAGRLDFARFGTMSDDDVLEALTQVKGIGRWTAEMYLMFSLNRLDVLPLDDAALRAAMNTLYGIGPADFVDGATRIAERWRPYRSVACRYLYRHLDESRRTAK